MTRSVDDAADDTSVASPADADSVDAGDDDDARSPPLTFELHADRPVHRCERCGRPLADEELLALHRGLAHPAALDDEEAAAFREAYADEQADVRRFRLVAVGVVLVLYFGLLMVYALV